MYCCCGVKKRPEGWTCECDWKGWSLCFEPHDLDAYPKDIPIKEIPDKDGSYEVRTFSDGDYHEEESEFSLVRKNWGQPTNIAISNWEKEYYDGWCGFNGIYAWKDHE